MYCSEQRWKAEQRQNGRLNKQAGKKKMNNNHNFIAVYENLITID